MRPQEVEKFIEEGIFRSHEDWLLMQEDAEKFLPNICNERCQMRI